MSGDYTPPGYLSFKQLYKKMNQDDLISFDQLIDKKERPTRGITTGSKKVIYYSINDLKETDREKLKALLNDPQLKASFAINIHKLASNSWGKATSERIIYEYQECQNDDFYFVRKDDKQESKKVKHSKGWLVNFVSITESWQFIRGALSSRKISSFILCDHKYYDLPETLWVDDSNWYSLIVDGRICTSRQNIPENIIRTLDPGSIEGHVFFNKEEVVKFCLELQATSNPESTLFLELWEKSKKGELKLRAAERLYLIAKITFPYTIKDSRGNDKVIGKTDNKVALERDLKAFAQDQLKFKIVEPQKEQGSFNEEDSLSEADIKAIATLLRNVIQQGR